MPAQLLLTNIGVGFTCVIVLALGVFVFVRRPATGSSLNVTFFLMSLSVAIWSVSYVLGINLHDSEASRLAFMFNLSTIPLIVFNTHVAFLITGRYQKQKRVLEVFYGIAAALIVYYILFPDTFLLPSQPQLYLPNFFVPGPLYWLQDTFFFIVLVYFLVNLSLGYRHADNLLRKKLNYIIIGFIYGYLIGLIPEFLLYDIPVDPWPVAFSGLYTIPIAYAILKYEVIGVNVLAKRTLGYALSITGVTLFILLIGYANDTLLAYAPAFPKWLLPLFSAVVAVLSGVIAWKKLKELDFLKYQFIDVVTHKFRTPLTYIRWSLDTLRKSHTEEEGSKALDAIGDAHIRLSELTDSLLGLSSFDQSQFLYSYVPVPIRDLVSDVVSAAAGRVQEKGILLKVQIPEGAPAVLVDRRRVQFALQMVFDNAVTYSNRGGEVLVSAEHKGDFVMLSVRDSGIGIAREDLQRLFSKFFRGSNASRAHTEGLGIGLYLSRDIMRRHGGDLWVESAGLGTGSTFFFKFPIAR